MDTTSDVDVIVMSVHGIGGQSVTSDLIKSGSVYGERVQVYDPGLSLLAMIARMQMDLNTFIEQSSSDQNTYLAKALTAIEDLDLPVLAGLSECGVVQLIDPIARGDIGNGRAIDIFLEKFMNLINQPKNFLMLDRDAGNVFREMAQHDDFVINEGATRRSNEASTANGLLGHLPRFKAASLDDVLGIRESLSDSLPRFRQGIHGIAKEFSGKPGETTTFDEIDDAWRATVAPSLKEIEELANENRFLRSLKVAGLSNTESLFGGGLGIVTAMSTGMGGVATALSGLIGTGLGISASAARQRIESRSEVRTHQFYLLHQVDKLLS
jgi:hypothetical protein